MRLTSTHITTSLLASAALAVGTLAIGADTTSAGQSVTSQVTVGRAAPTAGYTPSPAARAGILPGDVRVWDLTHGHSEAASGLLPGDVKVWELLHPWRPSTQVCRTWSTGRA